MRIDTLNMRGSNELKLQAIRTRRMSNDPEVMSPQPSTEKRGPFLNSGHSLINIMQDYYSLCNQEDTKDEDVCLTWRLARGCKNHASLPIDRYKLSTSWRMLISYSSIFLNVQKGILACSVTLSEIIQIAQDSSEINWLVRIRNHHIFSTNYVQVLWCLSSRYCSVDTKLAWNQKWVKEEKNARIGQENCNTVISSKTSFQRTFVRAHLQRG